MKKIPLKIKLLLLAAIPITAFIISGTVSVKNYLAGLNDIALQKQYIRLIKTNISLVTDTQLERGLSSLYLSGRIGAGQLEQAREKSSQSLDDFISLSDSTELFEQYRDDALLLFDEFDYIREDFDTGHFNQLDLMDEYNNLIYKMLLIIQEASAVNTSGGIGRLLSTINVIIQGQEYAGQLRGYLSGIFASDTRINRTLLFRVLECYEGTSQSLSGPGVVLTENSREIASEIKETGEWMTIMGGVSSIVDNYNRGDYGTDSLDFWNSSSAVIDSIGVILANEIAEAERLNSEIGENIKARMAGTVFVNSSVIILIIAFAVFIIRVITKPVNYIALSLKDIAGGNGDLTRSISVEGRDEIAQLAANFNRFTASLSTMLGEIRGEIETLFSHSRKLSESMEQTGSSEQQIAKTIESVRALVSGQTEIIMKSADSVKQFIDDLGDLRGMIGKQAGDVSESSASIEEMIASINSVTRNIDHTGEIVTKLVDSADDGKQKISDVAENIRIIEEQSGKLQEANLLIASISTQTNLLAMNAAIEAAHAGTYGKGFSVVADEIRKLAENSAEQSQKISANLSAINEIIGKTVISSNLAETSFMEMHEKVEKVSRLQEEVKHSMREQNEGTEGIVEALASINDITMKVNSFADRMGNESKVIYEEMQKTRQITEEVNAAINEMYIGAGEINNSVLEVLSLTRENRESIELLNSKVVKFRLREQIVSPHGRVKEKPGDLKGAEEAAETGYTEEVSKPA